MTGKVSVRIGMSCYVIMSMLILVYQVGEKGRGFEYMVIHLLISILGLIVMSSWED